MIYKKAISTALALFSVAACGRQPAARVCLLGGLESYQSPEEVRRSLSPSLPPWTVVRDKKASAWWWKPEVHEFMVSVEPFDDHGHSGRLTLLFINERLLETRFCPLDATAYAVSFRTHHGLKERPGNTSRYLTHYIASGDGQEYAEVYWGVDDSGQGWLGWADRRLEQDWHRRTFLRGES